MMETIEEEEETRQGDSGLREWMEENNDEIGNMVDPEYEL